MSQSKYAIYGIGGCGRSILPFARSMLEKLNISTNDLYFVDDNPKSKMLNGHAVLDYQEFLALDSKDKHVALAIADGSIRNKLATRMLRDEINMWSLCADNVVIMDDVSIGDGSILSPFVCITSNIKIGRCFHANLYSYVEHDCLIGDFVTFAPGVKCNGNIHIEDYAYIGAGAVLKQGTPDKPLIIGRGAVVGMGAVVTKNVPAGETVVGNPARSL